MRVLFATGSSPRYMAPPRLAEEQINCGPEWNDERGPDGRWVSLKTPVGEYNLAAIAAKLPPAQRPDVVVCLVDSGWRNQPRNLGVFKCPRVLLIADTHHMNSPLIGMMRYAISEPFTRRVLLYDRHHAAFFRSAGIKDLHWLPGLTFPHSDAVVTAARRSTRETRLAFVGQTGNFHPRRGRLLRALAAAGLDVTPQSLPQVAAMNYYGESLLGLNTSLNGDLNLRVFEIIAAGAGLLTDRLGAGSGSNELLAEGREMVTYASEEDLVERAGYWLQHPAEARVLGEAGARWFDEHLGEVRRRELFRALTFDGRSAPEFAFAQEESATVYFGGATDRVVQGVLVYEILQELHRTQERVSVAMAESVPDEVASLCATLPRIEVVQSKPRTSVEAADLDVAGRTDLFLAASRASRIWCWDAHPREFSGEGTAKVPIGFELANDNVAMFTRSVVSHATTTETGRHILVFTDDPNSGGVAQYNHSVMVGLIAAGFKVSCAQTRCDSPLVVRQRELGVRHHWIPYDTQREFGKTLVDQVNSARILSAAQPDLVLFSDCCPFSNVAAREVAMKARLPFIVVVGFVGAYLADRFKKMLGPLARQYRAARAVIAVSQENLDLLRLRFGLAAGSGEVIHYGRPDLYFAPRNEIVRARLRAEIGLPSAAVVSFTAARLTAVKGYSYQLIAAQRLLALPGSDLLHFVWAGDGEQREEIARAIASNGLTGRVHLLGHRWDVADWHDAADIFVLPSDLEGMPLAIMEAMAKGLPVAATAISGIPEELGYTGCLLPAAAKDQGGLIEQLVQILQRWTGDATLRRQMGEAGRVRANAMFRESLMVDRTVALIRRHVPVNRVAAQPSIAVSA